MTDPTPETLAELRRLRVGLHPSVRELPPRLRRRKACGTGRREDFAREVSHV